MQIHIPDNIRGIEPAIKSFVDAMVYKLSKNAHKGKWSDLDVGSAFVRMEEEREELQNAMANGNTVEILLEAADVANFALILANIAVTR